MDKEQIAAWLARYRTKTEGKSDAMFSTEDEWINHYLTFR